MGKMVILFVCLAVFEIASALQCYKCDNCQASSNSWEKSLCGSSGTSVPSNHEWACTQIKYKDKQSYKDAVQRKCVLVEKKNGKMDYFCPTALGEPVSTLCPICQTDLCNSATSIKFSFVALASILVAIIAPKFF